MSCKINPGIRIGISLVVTLLFFISLIFAMKSASTPDAKGVSVNWQHAPDTEKIINNTTTTTTIKKVVSGVVRVTTTNNQKPDANPNNQTETVDSPKNSEPETLQQKISIYKDSLNITDAEWVRVRIVDELIERRRTNYTAFNKIANASRMFEETEDKEILAEELLGMDENFVGKISDDIMSNKTEVRDHVRDYVNSVKTRKRINVVINESQVKDLFNGETATEDLIDSIWKNI